jgi:hypothetical protein
MGGCPGSEDSEPGLWRVTFVLSGGKDVTPRWLQPANKSLRPRLSFARLLRGEPRGLVARTNVSIARLTEWREHALAGAATALKERECDDRGRDDDPTVTCGLAISGMESHECESSCGERGLNAQVCLGVALHA